MTVYIERTELHAVTCGGCGTLFAMPEAIYQRRMNDKKSFWCPNGCERHFTGPSEAQRLRQEVERQQQMLEAERARAAKMERQRDDVARAHKRMRTRIQNGVCPCCNRTFQNLLRHMQTEHADMPALRSLREAYGLTQAQLAEEIGVNGIHISLAERGKAVAGYARAAIDSWVSVQAGPSNKTHAEHQQ